VSTLRLETFRLPSLGNDFARFHFPGFLPGFRLLCPVPSTRFHVAQLNSGHMKNSMKKEAGQRTYIYIYRRVIVPVQAQSQVPEPLNLVTQRWNQVGAHDGTTTTQSIRFNLQPPINGPSTTAGLNSTIPTFKTTVYLTPPTCTFQRPCKQRYCHVLAID
jgi:hypothetical protein